MMDYSELRKIKELVIIALFSDDDLMTRFVLKGGNAIDIAYKISERSSLDVDVSMESDFTPEELVQAKVKIKVALQKTFADKGFSIFDFSMLEQPPSDYPETKQFWGGYSVEFKIIETSRFSGDKSNLNHIRRTAKVVGERQQKIFRVDVSKFEFCKPKARATLNDYTIYVYTPVMVVYEKIRAICQQVDHYAKFVKSHRRGRAKDFFDVFVITEAMGLRDQLLLPDNIAMLKQIFAAKRVGPSILDEIQRDRDFHRDSFLEVKDAIYRGKPIQDFDFYFDYVLVMAQNLKACWEK